MDIAALVVSLVALVLSAAAVWFARRQAEAARAQADEAKRANELSLRIDWTLDADFEHGNSTIRLTNVGNAAATDVRLVLGFDPYGMQHGRHHWTVIAPGATQTIDLISVGSMHAANVAVQAQHDPRINIAAITWTDPAGGRRTTERQIYGATG